MALIGLTNAEKIWNYFQAKGMSKYGIAGLIGNLDCESALNPKNLQDTYEKKLGYNDEGYTKCVDSGIYKNFVKDEAGYGICQWTWHTRKQALLNYAKAKGASIGDLEMQLEFLTKEMKESFPSVWNTLMNAKSVYEASNAVLLKFEAPADTSASMQSRRASYGQTYYNMFANGVVQAAAAAAPEATGYVNVAKHAGLRLSANFTSNEFDCHGSGCCTMTVINRKLVSFLQNIHDHFGSPVTITSGYRCAGHNSSVSGAVGSRHTKGDAADIVVANHTPREVAQYAESIGVKGIGLYETSSDGHFVHVDTRDVKSFWYGQRQEARTTFGVYTASSVGAPTQTNPQYIKYGDSGDAVKKLQSDLIKLGFYCGGAGADGSFGLATKMAVQDFQKKHGLEADGIAGKITLAAIEKELSASGNATGYYEVTADLLNVRDGAGTNYKIIATVVKSSTLLVTEIKDGWGKCSAGWVSLQYCRRKG